MESQLFTAEHKKIKESMLYTRKQPVKKRVVHETYGSFLHRTIGNQAIVRLTGEQTIQKKSTSLQATDPVQCIKAFHQRMNPAGADIQPKRNNTTGLSSKLRYGVEKLSGISMGDVKVHFNSPRPARINALAYTQGTQIYVAPGQEKHLPHEAWHVIQQKQGRVKPTIQLKGIRVNDSTALEREADHMGQKAMAITGNGELAATTTAPIKTEAVQRVLVPFKTPAVPTANDNLIIADAGTIETLATQAFNNTWTRLSDATRAVNPVALDISQFPGVSAGHFTHFLTTLQNPNNKLKAAAAGYIIEDQITNHANLPAQATSQVHVGGAIPDFVITHGNKRGIVDITSTGEQGHVLNKKFTKTSFSYIAEATYPSIDFTALGGAPPVVAAAAQQLARQARKKQANRYINHRVRQLKEDLELSVHIGIDKKDKAALFSYYNKIRKKLNDLPDDTKWSDNDIDRIDLYIRKMNRKLKGINKNALQHTELSSIIRETRRKYIILNNPPW